MDPASVVGRMRSGGPTGKVRQPARDTGPEKDERYGLLSIIGRPSIAWRGERRICSGYRMTGLGVVAL